MQKVIPHYNCDIRNPILQMNTPKSIYIYREYIYPNYLYMIEQYAFHIIKRSQDKWMAEIFSQPHIYGAEIACHATGLSQPHFPSTFHFTLVRILSFLKIISRFFKVNFKGKLMIRIWVDVSSFAGKTSKIKQEQFNIFF